MKIRTDFVTNSSSTSYITINVETLEGNPLSLYWVEGEDFQFRDNGVPVEYRAESHKELWKDFEYFRWFGTPWVKSSVLAQYDGAQIFRSFEIPKCLEHSDFGRGLKSLKRDDIVSIRVDYESSGDWHGKQSKCYDLLTQRILSKYGMEELRGCGFAPGYGVLVGKDYFRELASSLCTTRSIPAGKANIGDKLSVGIENGSVILRDECGKKLCSLSRTGTLAGLIDPLPDGIKAAIVGTVSGTPNKPAVKLDYSYSGYVLKDRRTGTLFERYLEIIANGNYEEDIRALADDKRIDKAEVASLLWFMLDAEDAANAVGDVYRSFGNIGTYGGMTPVKAMKLGKLDCAKIILEHDPMVDHPEDFDKETIKSAVQLAQDGVLMTCWTGNAYNTIAAACGLKGYKDLLKKLLATGMVDKVPLDEYWKYKDVPKIIDIIFAAFPDAQIPLSTISKCETPADKAAALKHVMYAKLTKAQVPKALIAIAECSTPTELERFFAEVKDASSLKLDKAIAAAQNAGKIENAAWLLDKQATLSPSSDDSSLALEDFDAADDGPRAISKEDRDELVRGVIISLANISLLGADEAAKAMEAFDACLDGLAKTKGVNGYELLGGRVRISLSSMEGLKAVLKDTGNFSVKYPQVEISGWVEYHDAGVIPGTSGEGTKCDFWSIAGLPGTGRKTTTVKPGGLHPISSTKSDVSTRTVKAVDELFASMTEKGPIIAKVEGKKIPKTIVLENGEALLLSVNIDGRDTEAEEGSKVFEITVKTTANKALGQLVLSPMEAKAIALNITRVEAFVASVLPLVVAVDVVPTENLAGLGDLAFAFKKKNPFTSSKRYSAQKGYFAKYKERKLLFEDALRRFEETDEHSLGIASPNKPHALQKTPAKGEASVTVEPLVADWLKKVRIESKAKAAIKAGVKLASGQGECSPEALQLLVSLCYIPRSAVRSCGPEDYYDELEYLEPDAYFGERRKMDCDTSEFQGRYFSKLTKPAGVGIALAEITSWLDPEDLSLRLEHLYFVEHLDSALVALCRYGNESAIKRMTETLRRWGASLSSVSERKDYFMAYCALHHSRTKEGKRFVEHDYYDGVW